MFEVEEEMFLCLWRSHIANFSSLPSTCWIFEVERLVDDTHDGLACAPEINPDQDQSTVQA